MLSDFEWYENPNGQHILTCCSRIKGFTFENIRDVVGRVKKKNDNLWEWTILPNPRNPILSNCHLQGRVDSLETAKKKVEESVNVTHEHSNNSKSRKAITT